MENLAAPAMAKGCCRAGGDIDRGIHREDHAACRSARGEEAGWAMAADFGYPGLQAGGTDNGKTVEGYGQFVKFRGNPCNYFED